MNRKINKPCQFSNILWPQAAPRMSGHAHMTDLFYKSLPPGPQLSRMQQLSTAKPRHRTSKASAENGLLPCHSVDPSRFRLYTNTSPRQGTDTEHTARTPKADSSPVILADCVPLPPLQPYPPATLRSHNPAFRTSAGTSWLLHVAPVQRVFGHGRGCRRMRRPGRKHAGYGTINTNDIRRDKATARIWNQQTPLLPKHSMRKRSPIRIFRIGQGI